VHVRFLRAASRSDTRGHEVGADTAGRRCDAYPGLCPTHGGRSTGWSGVGWGHLDSKPTARGPA